MEKISRRRFISSSAIASMGVLVGCKGGRVSLSPPDTDAPPEQPLTAEPLSTVRVGLVGLGARGLHHHKMLNEIAGYEIRAICDIRQARLDLAASHSRTLGQAEPRTYTDYGSMIDAGDLDLLIISTPWEYHVPMCLSALGAGVHAATEVPAAMTVNDCWSLVQAAERNKRHCVMLENVNYGRAELTLLSMVRQGVFGGVNYLEGSYEHDLRAARLDANRHFPPYWRVEHSVHRNANLYPTHGLGPLANYLGINRGDRFSRLTAFSSPAQGLKRFVDSSSPPDSPYSGVNFACGDYVVALIYTESEKVVYLTYNTSSPRPYSRRNLVQGDRGIFQGYPDRIHIDGQSSHNQWEDPTVYFDSYRPRLWEQWDGGQQNDFQTLGHGAADNVMWLRLLYLLQNGLPLDMDVYDAAVLSAVTELTEISLLTDGATVEFPDFTRGRWQQWPLADYGLV